MRWLFAILLLLASISAPARLQAQELAEAGQATRSGLSIVESGTDRANNRLFSIQADGVEVGEVLRTLFKRVGVEYAIDQDVSGMVSFSVKGVAFREALQSIVQVAKPLIKVSKGKNDAVYHVSRDLEAQRIAEAASRIEAMRGGAGRAYPPVVPNTVVPGMNRLGGSQPGMQIAIPTDRPVTMDVPDDKPIPLADALNRISQQTRFQIFLDRRVPRDLSFAGTITEAPLSLVLQKIASTTGLKLLAGPTQATFVPPDQFTIRVNDMLLNQYPNAECAKCGQLVSTLWSYCPRCGQVTPRGAQLLKPRQIPGGQSTKGAAGR